MKEAIASNYLGIQHERHGHKRVRSGERKALVLGAEENNIGAAIAAGLWARGFNHVETPHPLDVRAESIIDHVPKLDDFDTLILANGETNLAWIEDQSFMDIDRVIHNSLTASVHATQQFVRATIGEPHLKYIVFIGSMAYRGVLNASAPYCAAKAGLAHFTRCMGWELTPKGYRVFCVNPSNTEGTPMTEETIEGIRRYRGLSREEAESYWGSVQCMRWLVPEDIGLLVAQLVLGNRQEFDFLSGTMIDLAGGQR